MFTLRNSGDPDPPSFSTSKRKGRILNNRRITKKDTRFTKRDDYFYFLHDHVDSGKKKSFVSSLSEDGGINLFRVINPLLRAITYLARF